MYVFCFPVYIVCLYLLRHACRRHDMEAFSELLALCEVNQSGTGSFHFLHITQDQQCPALVCSLLSAWTSCWTNTWVAIIIAVSELVQVCFRPVHLSQFIEPEWRIYASVEHTNIGSDNGLSPVRRQAIIWTDDAISLIRP